MRPVITPNESARLDATTEVPEAVLLERAGTAVAIAAAEMGAGYGSKVIVLAGPGNNGGDGWVAARLLRDRGAEVVVRSLGYPRGDGSPRRAAALAAVRAGVRVAPVGAPEPCDLIVDAAYGVGFRGVLPELLHPWVEMGVPVLAVDLPSGVDGTTGEVAGPAFRARRTVTFHAFKTGHLLGDGPAHSGEVSVADIGLQNGEPAFLLTEDHDAPVPPRARRDHKWSAGSVVVVGGSPGLVGATMLTGRAGLRFGAGAVRVVVPGAVADTAAAMDPGVMTTGAGDGVRFDVGDADSVVEAAERFDVMVVGPGLGTESGELVAALLDRWERALLIDADALTSQVPGLLGDRQAPTVLTPHEVEFERLTGEEADHDAAARLATDTGAVVLLKGSPTFVMGRERWAVTSGSPALATIGTGDVLAGMIAALVARGLDPEVATRSAAHRHGRAGRALGAITSVTATDLLDEIGRWAW